MAAAGDPCEDRREHEEHLLIQAAKKGFAEKFERILAVKDSLEQSMGQSTFLLMDLTVRLKEHEEQMEAILRQQGGSGGGSRGGSRRPTKEAPELARSEEGACSVVAQGSAIFPPDELAAPMPSAPAALLRGSSAASFEDPAQSDDGGACEPIESSIFEARHAELISNRHRRMSLTSRRRDVAALEVVQGWRKKIPEDVGGLLRKKSSFRIQAETPGYMDIISCLLVLINFIFMLVEVEVDMQSALVGEDSPQVLWIGNLTLSILFILELCFRIRLEGGKEFIIGRHWRWNVFDVLAVLTQLMDLILTSVSVGFIRVFRVVRMVRAVRIIKTARYVRDLRLMLTAIAASLVSLSWALLIILLTVVLYAMFVLQVVRAHVRDSGGVKPCADGDDCSDALLLQLYGSLPLCMLTLYMSITGGADWFDLVHPLIEISGFYLFTYILFMTFVMLGMLNILTAVFVESTNKLSEIDSDLVIMEQLDQETSAFNKMKAILYRADTDGSGTITHKEFEASLEDMRFKAEMALMDLHVHEARAAFHLLDAEATGEVDIDEMIHGLMRLKGTARALDMATMMYESKRVCTSLMRLTELTDSNFRDLKYHLQLAKSQAQSVERRSSDPSTPHARIMEDPSSVECFQI